MGEGPETEGYWKLLCYSFRGRIEKQGAKKEQEIREWKRKSNRNEEFLLIKIIHICFFVQLKVF